MAHGKSILLRRFDRWHPHRPKVQGDLRTFPDETIYQVTERGPWVKLGSLGGARRIVR